MLFLVGQDSYSMVKIRLSSAFLHPRLTLEVGERLVLTGEIKLARQGLVPRRHQISIVSAQDDQREEDVEESESEDEEDGRAEFDLDEDEDEEDGVTDEDHVTVEVRMPGNDRIRLGFLFSYFNLMLESKQ